MDMEQEAPAVADLRDAGRRVRNWVSESPDPMERAQRAQEAQAVIAGLSSEIAMEYSDAVRAAVAQDGPTNTAKKMGLSRQRIYQLVKHAE